jgi:hypothetical protein
MRFNLASANKAESPSFSGSRQRVIRRAPDKQLSVKNAGK